MKTATNHSASSASHSLPRRRSILLESRSQAEHRQALLCKQKQKRERAQQRKDWRKKFAESPLGKLFSSVGSLIWTMTVSLLLTLLACYFVMNPQAFESLTAPVEQFFKTSIAGAAPPASDYQVQTLMTELKVEKDFDARFLDDEGAIIEQLGTVRSHTERGYEGVLALERVELTPVLEVLSRKVDRSKEYQGFPTNDLAQLPQTAIFELRSEDVLGEVVEVSLRAAEWQWSVEEYDKHDLPVLYAAQVTFRGEEKWLDYSHLKATAHYKGELSKQVPVPVSTTEDPAGLAPTQGRSPRASSAPVLFTVNEPIILESESIDEEPFEPEITLPLAILDEVTLATSPEQDSRKRHQIIAATILTASATAATSAAAVVYYKKRKKNR